VISEIYDEVGQEGFQRALASGFDSTIPYVGNTEPEIVRGVVDWRRTLDLFEVVGGSTNAGELYETYVVAEDDAALLDERAEARAIYDEFVAASAGWGAPRELREAMAYWEFDGVSGSVDSAQQVLTLRDEVLAALQDVGVTEIPTLAEVYAGARPISDAVEEAQEYAETAQVLAAAHERPDGAAGLLTQIGLIGAEADARIGEAAMTLSEGEVDQARAAADVVLAEVEDAPLIGGIVLGEAVVGLALAWPLRAHAKRRCRRSTAVGSDSWPTDEPSSNLSAT
jgi:hypothetical protein